MRAAEALTPIEVAYGLAIGRQAGVGVLPRGGFLTPREAAETVLLGALRRPPCLVGLLGGRDSSALLAIAASTARKHGLPLPVPVTLVFPESDEAEETGWQRLVLDRLGLDEWIRLEFSDELDAVGPVAQEVMGRHGLTWPFNLHFHLPIMEAARGGSVITGFAGDELGVSCTVSGPERMVAERRIERPRDLAAIAYRLGPRRPRWPREFARAGGQIDEMNITWLTRRGRMALRSAFASDALLVPGWERILRDNLWRSRYFQVCKSNFQAVADHYDVTMCHPFVEPPVLQALARAGGFAGLRDREQILDLLAGDLLPPEVIHRQSKAVFGNSLWTRAAKEFAAGWDGRGLDERLVEPAAVQRAWTAEPRPAILSTTMLQAAWLAENGDA